MIAKNSYTVTLQEIIEEYEIDIFNFEYELSSVLDKTELEQAFIDKFYLRDIAHETVSIWLFRFKILWNRRIKFYNEIFEKFYEHTFEPLVTKKVTETETIEKGGSELTTKDETEDVTTSGSETETTETETSGEVATTGSTKLKDTPQTEWVDDGYLTGIQKDDSEVESSTKEDVNRERQTSGTSGKTKGATVDKTIGEDVERILDIETRMGTDVELMKKYVETRIDIIEMFLLGFETLFFGLY